jgi:hypothetical protein
LAAETINDRIKVTGTHPFYVQRAKKITLAEVQNLKKGDRLIDLENLSIDISSIEHINKTISVYNLIAINPNNNFYADGFLVHNKCGGGRGGFGRSRSGGRSATINEKTLAGFFEALIIVVVGLSTFAYWRQIHNLIIDISQVKLNNNQK